MDYETRSRLLSDLLLHAVDSTDRYALIDELLPNMVDGRFKLFVSATAKRVTTLTSMVGTIVLALVWSVVGIMSLAQIGLDITPILAGAGIVGLAVGFGAQNSRAGRH
ncbi:MAG: hypothetical protein ACOYXU_06790 [Nitrospirota bacterium]